MTKYGGISDASGRTSFGKCRIEAGPQNRGRN